MGTVTYLVPMSRALIGDCPRLPTTQREYPGDTDPVFSMTSFLTRPRCVLGSVPVELGPDSEAIVVRIGSKEST